MNERAFFQPQKQENLRPTSDRPPSSRTPRAKAWRLAVAAMLASVGRSRRVIRRAGRCNADNPWVVRVGDCQRATWGGVVSE